MEEHADDVPAARSRGTTAAPTKVDDSLFMAQMAAEGWLEHNEE